MTTEIKTFVEDKDGYITHITVSGDKAEEAWAEFGMLMGWFKDDGAKPNKGFENKVVRMGGGGKPPLEDTVPADLANYVPIHCDEKMIYRSPYKSQAGKDVGGKFQCRKGESCERAESFNGKKYGATIWEDKVRKEIEMELAG